MLRLWGVWNATAERWVKPAPYGPACIAEREAERMDERSIDSFSAKPFGDFIQVTPEVVAAVKELRSGLQQRDPFEAEIAKGVILNWACEAIKEEPTDA